MMLPRSVVLSSTLQRRSLVIRTSASVADDLLWPLLEADTEVSTASSTAYASSVSTPPSSPPPHIVLHSPHSTYLSPRIITYEPPPAKPGHFVEALSDPQERDILYGTDGSVRRLPVFCALTHREQSKLRAERRQPRIAHLCAIFHQLAMFKVAHTRRLHTLERARLMSGGMVVMISQPPMSSNASADLLASPPMNSIQSPLSRQQLRINRTQAEWSAAMLKQADHWQTCVRRLEKWLYEVKGSETEEAWIGAAVDGLDSVVCGFVIASMPQ